MNRLPHLLCLALATSLVQAGCSSESGPGVAPAPPGTAGANGATATPGKISPNIATPTTKISPD